MDKKHEKKGHWSKKKKKIPRNEEPSTSKNQDTKVDDTDDMEKKLDHLRNIEVRKEIKYDQSKTQSDFQDNASVSKQKSWTNQKSPQETSKEFASNPSFATKDFQKSNITGKINQQTDFKKNQFKEYSEQQMKPRINQGLSQKSYSKVKSCRDSKDYQPQKPISSDVSTPLSKPQSYKIMQPLQQTNFSSTIERGTRGKLIEVETNYLTINLDKMPKLAFHYDLTINPDRPKKFLRQAFEQFNSLFFKNIAMAFDNNKNVYTIEKLPFKHFEREIEIKDNNMRSMNFKVTIKETESLNIDLDSLRTYSKTRIYDKPMRALQCLDVVLSTPCHCKGVRIGRSFFSKPDEKYDLSDGYEMWIGLFQAAILGDTPFLNVDISNKSFFTEDKLTNFLVNKYRNQVLKSTLMGRDLFAFRSYIKGLNILYEPPQNFGVAPKTFKVVNVTDQSALQLTFTVDESKKMTVAEYFKSRGYNLQYPNLNCLQVGSTVRKVYLPIEFCKINSGQAPNKKDGAAQVQKMIRFAATSTNIRKSKIEKALQYFLHNNNSVVQKFGIRIDPIFCRIPLRILNPPSIVYKTDAINPMKGTWRMNERSQFLRTSNLQCARKWSLIYYQRSKQRLNYFRDFVSMFFTKAKQMNIDLENKPEIREYNKIGETLRDLKKQKFDLVLVVLPNYDVSYADIKQSAELQYGILTQCIKETTIVQRMDNNVILNLLLKVNAKLNGTNHHIKDIEQTNNLFSKVMYLGADVTHPSPDQCYIPSVVGVAASHDAHGACYNMQYRLQRSTVEVIEDMESIIRNHLEVYKKHQNSYPENIIYYRDGVSDGQFASIKQVELRGIRAACSKLNIKPKITCIVVVKRHHTRFFPKETGYDKFNNVPPGSVVDRIIVHPNEVQFFMVSHVSVQGTARPTRYNVIEDDARINIDALQKLTYNMCHMFPRCNRSVSYPAPAYLAHLVAFRGRVYLEGNRSFDEPRREYEKRKINTDLLNANPMYFV